MRIPATESAGRALARSPGHGYAPGRCGFTLIEVMVALLIVFVAGMALTSAYINVLNAYAIVGKATEKSEDVRFARAQLLAEADRTKAEEGNNFDLPDGGHIAWKAKIEPTDIADLFTVTFNCEITGTDKVNAGPVNETFMLMRPTWSDGAEASKLRDKIKERITEVQQKRVP